MNFRQRGEIKIKETPVIRVTPIRIKVACVDQQVALRCSVNSPYEVEFQNLTETGKPKTLIENTIKLICYWELFTY